MRRSAIPIALSLALLAGSGAIASDQIYKCIDPNGATVLSDKPCSAVESVPADAVSSSAAPAITPAPVPDAVAALPNTVATLSTVETERPAIAKEYYKLPPAEIDRGSRAQRPLASAGPKIDVATLKAARLNLEMSDKTASLR